MSTRYIFTVTAGRSGQNSLADVVQRHVPDCLTLFEEPQIRPWTPRPFSHYERLFRRRFVETHELLGRGKVIQAFVAGDETALERYARRRLAWIDRRVARAGARAYLDVSKYFVRGLHRPIARLKPGLRLVRLVRDPILNMRSFLNRGKDIYLDNNRPDAAVNQLRLDPAVLEPGALYLWAWCEVYLRADALADEFGLHPIVEIRTDELLDSAALARHLRALGFETGPVDPGRPLNRNVSHGYAATQVSPKDIATFERFRDRLPAAALDRITYLRGYDPRATHGVKGAA